MLLNTLFRAKFIPQFYLLVGTKQSINLYFMPYILMVNNSINIHIFISPSLMTGWILNMLHGLQMFFKKDQSKNLVVIFTIRLIRYSDELINPSVFLKLVGTSVLESTEKIISEDTSTKITEKYASLKR